MLEQVEQAQHNNSAAAIWARNKSDPLSRPRGVEAAQPNRLSEDGEDGGGTAPLSRTCKVALAIMMMAAVALSFTVMVVVVKSSADGGSSTATTPNRRPPPSEVEAPLGMIDSPTEQLKLLRACLQNHTVLSKYAELLPATPDAIKGQSANESAHPIVRAADWLVTLDDYNAQVELTTRFGLAAVYYAHGGSNWTRHTNWLGTNTSLCEWQNIKCCGSPDMIVSSTCFERSPHELVELDLNNNNLQNTHADDDNGISDVFGLLTDVRALWLSYNDLQGPVPGAALGSLPKLRMLYLQHNNLSGQIPTALRNNGVLDTLYINANNFTGEWPEAFCPACGWGNCPDVLRYFRLDCDKMIWSADCVLPRDHCFDARNIGGGAATTTNS